MKRILAAAAVLALSATMSQAATISVGTFSKAAYDARIATMPNAVVENFESFSEGNVANAWSDSAVGSFSSLGGTGNGGTVRDGTSRGNFVGNDGRLLALRDGTVYGRTSTTSVLTGNAADDMFLDSNDTYGISWVASLGGRLFDRILLTLTDATDVGARMNIRVGDAVHTLSGLGDRNVQLVEIIFGGPVETATILFENVDRYGNPMRNDGFSLDDIALSAVPLPAGAWLMLGGFGALAALRRRRRAT